MLNADWVKFIPVVLFVVLLALQAMFPRRPLSLNTISHSGQSNWQRIGHNFLLFAFNVLLTRVAVPLSVLAVSVWASENGLGLFNSSGLFSSSGLTNLFLVPDWLTVLVCVVALDFAIYWQHVATHHWPILWRMHKVHHADSEMDVTTAIRFHPLELLLSLVFKSLIIVMLGAPIAAVIIFELLLFIGPAFNHSNVKLPIKLDRFLRFFIATPDTHRAHHSTLIHEQNTNYGFFLIWWDKIFNTYTQEPIGGHDAMSIGLVDNDDQCPTVQKMLLAPFK